MSAEPAVVGLGANIGRPQDALADAVRGLARLPGTALAGVSSLYRSDPVGGPEQPPFLNAAVLLEPTLEPRALLAALHELEAAAGRVRTVRWGPRTLDLDLLLYGSRSVDEPDLQVPHPRLVERRFALEPTLEVWPAATLPDGRPLRALLGPLAAAGVERLAVPWSTTL